MSESHTFNPLDKQNLGVSVAQALLSREPVAISKLKPFKGAGVYALYYAGPFKPYARISKPPRDEKFRFPIYVGKAENKNRKGSGMGTTQSTVLYKRLLEHSESIELAKNLEVKDFYCRFLVVDDIWVPLGENLLIAKFSPVWNTLIDGFGNHDPGSGRYQGMRPRWDVLHPGRLWAGRCQPRPESAQQIAGEVEEYLRSIPTEPPRFYMGEPLADYTVSAPDDAEEG